MRLELKTFPVKRAEWAAKTELVKDTLCLNRRELTDLVMSDNRLKSVQLDLALPGENIRIIHVLDVLEPRYKKDGEGCVFPGFMGPPTTVGRGCTHRIEGLAVVETAEFASQGRGLLMPWEHIIDMSGPGARYSPFSTKVNLVLGFQPADRVSLEEYDAAIRLAAMKVSTRLAELTRDLTPARTDIFELAQPDVSLPRFGYIHQCASEGTLHNTFLYGEAIPWLTPTLIHPNELIDGALVSGKYGINNPTYVYLNDLVVRELYRLHGREVNFVGVILTTGGGTNKSDFAKSRDAQYAAKLLKLLDVQGAVLAQEGGGNSIMDQMLICQSCERFDIKTTLISYEMGGKEGTDVPLIFTVPEADAIVSTGNREEMIHLPAVDRVLGGDRIWRFDVDPKGEIDVYADYIMSSIDQAGTYNLRAWQY